MLGLVHRVRVQLEGKLISNFRSKQCTFRKNHSWQLLVPKTRQTTRLTGRFKGEEGIAPFGQLDAPQLVSRIVVPS